MNLIFMAWFGMLILQTCARKTDLMPKDVYNQCVLISEPFCQDVKYTHTRMPNQMGIYSQSEASKRVRDYFPLITLHCSNYLKLFLCSMYFPVCDSEAPVSTPVVQPCQKFCHHVKSRCEPLMQKNYQLSWSQELDCDSLPATGKMCLLPDSFVLDNDENLPAKNPELTKDLYQQLDLAMKKNNKDASRIDILVKAGTYIKTKCLPSQINIGQNPNITCSQRCDADIKFNDGDKSFANVWLIGWSLLCLVSSLFTIITFSCNTNRFMYPEKPIVFLSICYFFYSCGNLLGAVLGRRNVICRPFDEQFDYLASSGNETTWCKINFLMLYFFSSAGALWWVVLTITWFLSASRHWGYEAIESISSVLHLISWGIPALKSIFVLILHKIDADELTGQCYVGNEDKGTMLGFILVPQTVYLMTGITFLALGYFSILKVRKSFLRQPSCLDTTNLKRLEKLMAKIGVFSVLYIVPVTCTIVSYVIDVFKTSYFDVTLKALYEYSSDCVTSKGLSWSLVKCVDIIHPALPSVEMRMLRIFMNLVIGITSGIWIWGNKKSFRCRSKNTKDTPLCELKPIDILNPMHGASYPRSGDSNPQFHGWTYTPTVTPVPASVILNQTPGEGLMAPNNSSISEVSSKH